VGLLLVSSFNRRCSRFGIVTDEDGSAELVEEGRTGFIARAAKVEEFDDAMGRAWDARERWESIGKAAVAAVRTMVPSDPIGAFTAKLLDLLSSPKLSSRVPGKLHA
jgi:glycosyltransferase involved in cell wall biosynthesis